MSNQTFEREEIITRMKRLQMYRRTVNTLDGANMHIFRPNQTDKQIQKLYRDRVKKRKYGINQRMRDKNMTCQLSYIDIILLLQERTCFYTNQRMKEHNITFDRVDNNYGYDAWNVVTCTKKANIAKSSLFEDKTNPNYLGPITDFSLEYIKEAICNHSL